MDLSAPKRRKTSPTTAVPIAPEPSVATKKRPSFASPTKASLERHNPEILRRRESEGSPKKPGQSEPNAPSPSQPISRLHRDKSETAKSQPEREIAQSKEKPKVTLRELRSRGRDKPETRRAAHQIAAFQQQQSPAKLTPRSLPHARPDDDSIGQFDGPRPGGTPPGVPMEMPEPELPPAPENDPVVSTPPSGIHKTPTKRAVRRTSLSGGNKGSPLKLAAQYIPTLVELNDPSPERPHDSAKEGVDSQKAAPDLLPDDILPGIDLKLINQYEALVQKVASLTADVEIIAKENERIRQAELSKTGLSPPPNQDRLLQVLYRGLGLSRENPKSKSRGEGLEFDTAAELHPIAFLPFGMAANSLPMLLPENQPVDKDDDDLPVSHHPLRTSAKQELHLLQAFTPLAFTSHITLLPKASETPDEALFQRHSIMVTSTSPPGLFTARVEMTVNTKTQEITELAVPRLDPAAITELTPFIESIVRRHPESRALTRNVNVLGWSMGEWLRVSVRRAKAWRLLERELASKTGLAEIVAQMRGRKRRRRPRRADMVDKDGADTSDTEERGGTDGFESSDPGELLPYLGRTSMEFEIPRLRGNAAESAHLRVNWRVEFDWTGDAQCRICVLVGVPEKWHKSDDQEKLSDIPALFDQLLEEGELPADAVRIVAALLAGED